MFADIVPEQLRSTVYAFDRSFEGAVAACAAPLVGKPPLATAAHMHAHTCRHMYAQLAIQVN